MTATTAPSRTRYAMEQSKRTALRERATALLGGLMLMIMLTYMLVGDRPFHPDLDAASEISAINRWVWIGLMALAIPMFWLRRKDLIPMARAAWPLFLLYAWFLVTTFWALDPAASTRRVLQSTFALFICGAIVLGLRRAERIHWLLCIPCLAVATVDLGSWFVVPGIAMTPLGLQGMHGQKNVLGQNAMYTILLAATYAFTPMPRLTRIALLAGTGIAAVALLASRSSTSTGLLLAAAIMLPTLVVVLRRRRTTTAAVLLSLVLALVAALALYLMWCGATSADPLAPLAGVTFTRRTDLWAFLIQNIEKRPWGGAGYASFWAINPAVQPSLHSGLWFGQKGNIAPEGHDAYLDLTATTGLIGAALGLMVLVRAVAQAAMAVRTAPRDMPLPTAAFSLGLPLILIGHSFTESTLFGANNPLYTLFVLSVLTVSWSRFQQKKAVLF